MGHDGAIHRRFRMLHGSPLSEGLYDSVVDTRLQHVLEHARNAGIEVETRDLRGRDGRLLARELARVVIEAIEARLNADEPATNEGLKTATSPSSC